MRRGRGSDDYDEGDEVCEIECKILHRTEDGIRIRTDNGSLVWLPRKYVVKTENGIVIPEWLAMDRELI